MKPTLSDRLLILTCAIVSLGLSSTPLAANLVPLGNPESHAERQMHGGTPLSRGQHHLAASIFDGKTRERLENAADDVCFPKVWLLAPIPYGSSAGLSVFPHYRPTYGPTTFARSKMV